MAHPSHSKIIGFYIHNFTDEYNGIITQMACAKLLDELQPVKYDTTGDVICSHPEYQYNDIIENILSHYGFMFTDIKPNILYTINDNYIVHYYFVYEKDVDIYLKKLQSMTTMWEKMENIPKSDGRVPKILKIFTI